ncbi:MAG TPA: kelch repeat-containing protein [Candidatus Udaeobacter sp.]|nr:kelch repeat-containing protein [Candidatus Udaeobacter sp.]
MKRIKAISSVTLIIFALLVAIKATNPVANPKWGPLNAGGLTFPLLRVGSTSVYDPISNTMILFAGASADVSLGNPRLNDVWVLTNANGLGGTSDWSKLDPTGAPPVRERHSAVYDAVNNRMIIYGGCGGIPQNGCFPIADDVWVLDHANGVGGTPTWTQLFPTGARLGARQGHQAVYDSNTNSMIVWAGQNGGGQACSPGTYSDVWVPQPLPPPFWPAQTIIELVLGS